MKRGNIVVLGATGTLGVHIAIHLKKRGYNVFAAGHRKNDNSFFEDYGIPYYSIDISDLKEFDVLPQSNIYAVLHFAGALPATMEGYVPTIYVDSIVKGTLNVLEYTRKCGAEKIIFPQSLFDISYLFGSKVPIPADSERKAPLTGDHAVYVIAKMAAVNLIEHYYHNFGLKRFILRLSRIYMFHPNPYTFTDGNKCMISDRFLIDQAIKGETLEIWGDPDRLLETICINDFLQIVERCVQSNLDGGIYNVGSGGSTLEQRVRDIVDVFSPSDKKSEIVYCPEKRDSQQFVLDISKTKNELGYEPNYDWKSYLIDFKNEMKNQPLKKIWGSLEDYRNCSL